MKLTKRIFSAMLALVMLCTCAAYADEYNYIAPSDNIIANGGYLPVSEKKSGNRELLAAAQSTGGYDHSHDDEIAAKIGEFCTEVDVTGYGITKDNAIEVALYIVNSHPELFYVKGYGYSADGATGKVSKLLFLFTDDVDTLKTQKAELEIAIERAKAELIAQNIESMTDTGKALCIHDYLCSTVGYDYANLNNNTIPQSSYNIYGVLVKYCAVCQGYAEAYMYLARQFGLNCTIATSNAACHAWNVIELDGKWYHMDPTWDDPVWDCLGRASHDWFLLSTDELLALDESRSDMVVLTFIKDGYTSADSTIDGFWDYTDTRTYFDGSYWYYIDGNGKKLIKTDFSGENKTTLLNLNYYWVADGGFYSDSLSKLFGYQGKLYYSTPTSICAYEISSGKSSVIFSPALDSNQSVFGMALRNGEIAYSVSDSAYPDDGFTVLTTELKGCEHSYTSAVTAPTCAQQGYTTHTCTKCGDSYKDSYTDKLPHSYGEWTVTAKPSCTEEGTETRYCKNCEDFETRAIAAAGHSYTAVVTDSTCTTRGYTTHTCTTCGHSYKDSYTDKLPHDYTTAVTAPTTKKMGYTTYTCTECGDSYKANYTLAAPTISIARSSGKPKLTWSAIGGATKYYIYRSTDGKKYTYLTYTTKTSYTNTGAASGTKYYYKVVAVAVVDGVTVKSAYSNIKSMITTLAAPTVSITRSSGHPKISWKAVTGATKYNIYRSTDGGKTYKYLTYTTKLSYTNTKATAGKTYYYKLKAVTSQSSAATSAYSKAVYIKAK